jgi:hypothetical protein
MSPTKAWCSLEPYQRFEELLDAAALQIQEREAASSAGTPEDDEEGRSQLGTASFPEDCTGALDRS